MATEYPWPTRPLGNAGTWLSGGTPSKDNSAFWSGTVPWVSPKDMKAARIGDAIDHVSNAAVGNGTRLVPSDTLLMVVRGMILAHTFPVALTTSDVAFNQDIKALQAARDFLPDFLLYWLQSRAAEILKLTDVANHGTRRLPTERLFALETPVPPLPEQRKIAAILSAVDEVIEKTEAVIESLQALKKAMMQELLTRGLPGRHTRFKQTEIGEVPEEWEVARVGEVCELRNNLRKPIEVSERERMSGPYPYYGPTKVLSHINEYRVEGMHALIGEDGDHFLKYDKWPMTQLLSGRFNVNNHAHVVRGSERCATEWFFLFFKHRDIVQHLTRQGAGRYKLRKATLMDLLVALPPVDEQLAIFRTLRTVEQYVEGEVEQKTAATKLKSALMSVLLTGELRVTPDKDVA